MSSFYDDYYNNEPTNQYGNSVYNEPVYGTPNMNEPEQPNRFLYEAGKSLRNCFWLYMANYGVVILLFLVSVVLGIFVGLIGDMKLIDTTSNTITIITIVLTIGIAIPISIQFNTLRDYLDSYNKVFWTYIISVIISTILTIIPMFGVESNFLSIASSLVSILYALFFFKSNSEIVQPYSYDLNKKWSNLWKWFIYPLIGIIVLSIPLICLGLAILAYLIMFAGICVVLVGVVLLFVYLWKTSSILISASNYR